MIPFLVIASLAAWAAGPVSSPSRAPGETGEWARVGVPFSLSISERREEQRDPSAPDGKSKIVFETQLTLHGRFVREDMNGRRALAVCADSITFVSRRPLAYRTFLSADTMYYHAPGGRAVIDPTALPAVDTMLACLFCGPALRAHLAAGGAVDSLQYLKAECQSGEFQRVNMPVTLGFFLPDSPTLAAEEGARWLALRNLPLFSGVPFHPAAEIRWHAVDTDHGQATVVFSADSTFGRRKTTLANGEEAVIIRDRVRVGGTLVLERVAALPVSGEVRIRERMEILRPQLGPDPVIKYGEYTIRIRTK